MASIGHFYMWRVLTNRVTIKNETDNKGGGGVAGGEVELNDHFVGHRKQNDQRVTPE